MTALQEFDINALKELMISYGEPEYRAGQLMRHIVNYDAFDRYTCIPKRLIEKLAENYIDRPLTEKTRVTASDGAIRYLFETTSGDLIESVFLPHEYGNSVCVSCQVGCAMGCVFCASGHYGLKRDLTAGEILSQVLFIARDKKNDGGVKKVVMMGSGSPLANYDNTIKFVKLLTAQDGINIGMRSLSISTCGLPDRIDRLCKDGFTGTLSLSLHAAIDSKRIKIMKIAERYSIEETVAAMKRFFDATGRRVIIEYILIDGFNNKNEDVTALKALLKGLCCHVNLIPLNPTDNFDMKPPSKKSSYAFMQKLIDVGISATVRRSMGSDAAGACGQLKNRTMEKQAKLNQKI